MADGEHPLPPNEELFDQPMEQEPQQYELQGGDEHPQDQDYHGVPEDPQASGGDAAGHEIEHQYGVQDYYDAPPPPPTNRVFQPVPQQNFVAPQPREVQNYEEQGAGDAGAAPPSENGEEPPGESETVWIDSDSDEDPEAEFLRNNFGLTYSDHNYDCPDPSDRVIHPQEGPFPVIGGLSEDGRIVKLWMPDGYGPPHREGYIPPEEEQEEAAAASSAVKEDPLQQQHHQEYQSPPLQQQQVIPMRQPNLRPMVAAQPFSIGGNQVEYAEPRMPPQRGYSVSVARDLPQQSYRVMNNDFGGPSMAPQQQHHSIRAQSVNNPRLLNNNPPGPPHATIIRQQPPPSQNPQQPQGMYQPSPQQGSLRGTPLSSSSQQRLSGQPTPGSYQHIVNPSPSSIPGLGGSVRRQMPVQGAPRGIGGPGIVVSNRLGGPPNRPVHITRPMTDNLDRDFIEHPMPLPPQGPPRRPPADVAPHRMTQEQRMEQQLLNRQRAAQFPMHPVQRPPGVPPQQQAPRIVGIPPTQQAAIIGRGRPVASPGQEDLLRSPQRVPERGQPVVCEPRKFQVRVTDTYSAPIPKASDQLPAQLTEDPPEIPPKHEEPGAAEQGGEDVEASEAAAVADTKQEIKSPPRLASSATSSPVKHHHGASKPTPPHRMSQEEKSAHFAKLNTDKEKPSTPSSLPIRGGHHQDDTLAVVQSVFESNKPRQPDTPKDKEAISKIADLLRFSADEFTGASSASSSTPPRAVSVGSAGRNPAQNYPQMVQQHAQHQPHAHHLQNPHQNPHGVVVDEGRKRHGSGRYDSSSSNNMRGDQQQDAADHHHHTEAGLEPPQRQRGRPRGTTSSRFGGPEPVAPHRAAGGARTLQPRHEPPPPPQPPQQSSRNAATSKNSDSESEAVDSESWEMRCHCEMDHGDGDTVECESCKTWQHMACMGLNMDSDTSKYKCEQCQPRRLPVSKSEAIKAQKKILEKLRRATEREKRNKRKSEPVEPVKPVVQQSRKSAPMPLQPLSPPPPTHRVPQLNEYSRLATSLLTSMQQTAGADQLLEESRRHNKAKRMYVEENVEALVTIELVQIRQVILEVNGYVAMATEMKRQPGGGNCVFMYDGLMKGTAGEDMGSGQELVCIDTKKKGNDTRFTRRSCVPNCVLKHVLGSQATLGIMVVATKDILRNTEVTLPFDADWKDADAPLDCAEHMRDILSCPFEQERRRAHSDRQRVKDTEKRRADEAKRADEERRRLEEEVRRERAAKTKQLEEEAEKERLEQERVEKEKKAKEREEAKKKREAEKKKEQEKREAESSSSRSSEGITSRDNLRVQQAEERFRLLEEEEKRREARRSRSKSQTPKPDDVPTSSAASSSDSRHHSRRSHQKKEEKESEASKALKTPKTEIPDEDTPTTSGVRSSKRMKTPSAIVVAASGATPAAKKSRRAESVAPAALTSSRKRGAPEGLVFPAAKRTTAGNRGGAVPKYKLGVLSDDIHGCATNTMIVDEFEPPGVCKEEDGHTTWAVNAETNDKLLKAKKEAKTETSPQKKAPIVKKKEEKEVKMEPKSPRVEKTSTPASAPDPEDRNTPGPAPPPAASPKKSAPGPSAPPKAAESQEREASISTEGSVEKELTPSAAAAAAKKAPKKLSLADYASRRSQKKEEPGASGGSTSGATGSTTPSTSTANTTTTRRGFIPSTDGLGGNVQLSAIPLDNHPANASITTTAPSQPTKQPPPPPPPTSPPAPSITSPSTRSRARAAASESADDAPVEHQMSLIDRIAQMFGGTIDPAAANQPPPPPPPSQNNYRRNY